MKRRTKCVQNPPDQYDHQVCPQQSSLVYPCYIQKQAISPKPPPINMSTHPVLTMEHGCGEVSRISEYLSDIWKIRKTEISQGKNNITRLEQILKGDSDKFVTSRSIKVIKQNSDMPINVSNTDDPKPSIVYGVITAKEMAKYLPCTQDIIIRTEVK